MRSRGFLLKVFELLLISSIISSGWALYTPQQLRTVLNLNKTWKFVKQDVAVSQAVVSSDPSNRSDINLPHSFDIPYWAQPLLYHRESAGIVNISQLTSRLSARNSGASSNLKPHFRLLMYM